MKKKFTIVITFDCRQASLGLKDENEKNRRAKRGLGAEVFRAHAKFSRRVI